MAPRPRRPRIVMKFGGTSVADVERIRAVARQVKTEVDSGNDVVVVVSAMAGATNQLVEWTSAASRLHDVREYDVVVSSGEQVTSGLVALALQELGVSARPTPAAASSRRTAASSAPADPPADRTSRNRCCGSSRHQSRTTR